MARRRASASGQPRGDGAARLGLEARGELVHRVDEVVRVARLVAEAEDRDGLTVKRHRGEVAVEELVPRRARALGVRAGVPRGRAAHEAVIAHELIRGAVGDVLGLGAENCGRETTRISASI